jgi:hypothetical protein
MDAFIGGRGLAGVACVIVGGVVLWMMLGMCILKSPLADALMTKETKGVSKVDVVERVTGGIHALISSGFGIYAWTAVSVGQCTYDSKTEMVLRFGVALTAAYLINDFFFLFLVEAVQRTREPWWSMWMHHINIVTFFFIGLASNHISWFMCANLINEVSTVPINVGFMMKAHGYSGSLMYNAVGMLAFVAFTVLRIAAIPYIGYLFYQAGSCSAAGASRALVSLCWAVLAIHFILNAYWYCKLLALAAKTWSKPDKAKDERAGERVPLFASEAGLGPSRITTDPPSP